MNDEQIDYYSKLILDALERFAVDVKATLTLVATDHGEEMELAVRKYVAQRLHTTADLIGQPL